MKGRALMSNGDRSTVPYIRNTYRLIGFQEVAPPIFFFPPLRDTHNHTKQIKCDSDHIFSVLDVILPLS